MPKQLKNVLSEGEETTITVIHTDGQSEIVPIAPLTTYGYVTGDTFVAEGGVSFDVEFDAPGGGGTTVVSVEGAGPATFTVPEPSFFDSIVDHVDEEGEPVQTLQILEETVSIRG